MPEDIVMEEMIEKYVKLVIILFIFSLFNRIAKIVRVQFLKISLDIICLFQASVKQIFRNSVSNFLVFTLSNNI